MIPPALLARTTATIKKSWLCSSNCCAAVSNVRYGRKLEGGGRAELDVIKFDSFFAAGWKGMEWMEVTSSMNRL